MGKKTFLIDVEKCSGCELCTIACKDEHVGNSYSPWTKPQPDTGQFWIGLTEKVHGHVPHVKVSYVPQMCHHCDDAPRPKNAVCSCDYLLDDRPSSPLCVRVVRELAARPIGDVREDEVYRRKAVQGVALPDVMQEDFAHGASAKR